MPKNFLFTSESVSEGHPDKICDQISDTLVDAYLARDPYSRLAIETFATTNRVIIGGETRAPEISKSEIENLIRKTVKEIGYEQEGFHFQNLEITNLIHGQSSDIAIGVDASGSKDEGAGDQGIMFGYAVNETEVFMPAAIYYAHRILHNIMDAVRAGEICGLGPDAKSQVTLWYENSMPVRAENVLVSIQHKEGMTQKQVRELIHPYVKKSLPKGWMCKEEKFLVNPTGKFVIGGPDGDAGLTGRKIIVDTYGGAAPHGGGAFSGKDPTKVDRSAAYMARYLAKNVVAAGLATRCTIQISYAIGVSKPLSLYVNNHKTGVAGEDLVKIINELIDLSPRGIRTHLGLNKPIYKRTATYGHFGRNPEADGGFSWEKTDLAERLKKLI
ncbi:MAG: methionine adenosyltransferase [Alphaproteobacteria bacterium RIFCSPLOWO2_01_FULL_40_26]|nr:MAG: methionine adenosyltransferase [Alphaproteobacteria bacterium RIFCSPHIGHO2_02_FULL_40_34]OFW94643.1 MAG: methionine adenosyltransferase [Alphaproteobacteria bacterium RIFCSPLOWO2_01_FULL_40_26]OFX10111.1 MAG: methionine adenosyltransferase [Alphaproteobacteria bacterium RIFCSPLOWO2_02_FULL_40_19]OFX11741.1 MAG: methionine adenosyltransferase [Alphaproteobacteria bacterium RIFCSPLOWO2_12_FULL_40_11]